MMKTHIGGLYDRDLQDLVKISSTNNHRLYAQGAFTQQTVEPQQRDMASKRAKAQ